MPTKCQIINSKMGRGWGIRQMGIWAPQRKNNYSQPYPSVYGDTTNHSVLSFWAELWLIARFSNSSKSVFKLKGLTFQNINVVGLRIMARCVCGAAIPDTSAIPTEGKTGGCLSAEWFHITCAPLHLPSSGGKAWGRWRHTVICLGTHSSRTPGWLIVFTGLLSPGSCVLGSHSGPSRTAANASHGKLSRGRCSRAWCHTNWSSWE